MRIIGCDLHTRQPTLAMLDTETGEIVKRTLKHGAGSKCSHKYFVPFASILSGTYFAEAARDPAMRAPIVQPHRKPTAKLGLDQNRDGVIARVAHGQPEPTAAVKVACGEQGRARAGGDRRPGRWREGPVAIS